MDSGDTPGASLIADTLLASELDKEEPPCGRHASGRDETLASELTLDSFYEISFRSFVVSKKNCLTIVENFYKSTLDAVQIYPSVLKFIS